MLPFLKVKGAGREVNPIIKNGGDIKILCILFLVPLLIIAPTKLLYFGLMQSRYYLPVFIFLHLATGYLLFHFLSKRVAYTLYSIILLSLISGHFWVYPERISQNWDGTLGHLPYHRLRDKMIKYIDEKKIPFHEVASDFPNDSEIRYTDLNDDKRHFSQKIRNQLHQHKYVFYSNVFNGFTVGELEELNSKWVVEQSYETQTVYVKLFKNPGF